MEIKSATPPSTRLLLPEYGRNVQKMVHFLRTIEERELRNRQAEVVVGLMANLYPHKRDSEEFRNMLWDHLFMIADFDLDIDAPFPRPTPDQFSPVPERMPYPKGSLSQKQYGRYAATVIKTIANASEDSAEDKEQVAVNTARFMRQKSYEYNNEYPDNRTVIADVNRLAAGNITLEENALDGSQLIQKKQQPLPIRTGNVRRNNNNNRRKK